MNTDCLWCSGCEACRDCRQCRDCHQCRECTGCRDCYDCRGYVGFRYLWSDEQLSREAYAARLAAKKEEEER